MTDNKDILLEILNMLDVLKRACSRAKIKGGDDHAALWQSEERDIDKTLAVMRDRLKDEKLDCPISNGRIVMLRNWKLWAIEDKDEDDDLAAEAKEER